MNYHKYLNSAYLKENPLCGIDTYKDELNLAMGACTRKIQKLIFDGTESWQESGTTSGRIIGSLRIPTPYGDASSTPAECIMCSHIVPMSPYPSDVLNRVAMNQFLNGTIFISFTDEIIGGHSFAEFINYLQQQYANNTPLTVWYVKATTTTETITVPSGLSGTIEGYLNQSGTPTPTNPIYPTANNAMGWYDIDYHKRSSSAWTDVTNLYERDNGAWTNS